MQQSCQRCGKRFTQHGDDTYCPNCKDAIEAKMLSKKSVNPTITLTCENCGDSFEHDVTAKGRRPKYCLDCRKELSAPPEIYQQKKAKEAGIVEDRKALGEAINAYAESIVDDAKAIETVGRTNNDPVNHPSHYTRGNIEVIDFIEDQELPYHLGNVVKYICRAGFKGDKVEDLKKARWYLDRYIKEVLQDGK